MKKRAGKRERAKTLHSAHRSQQMFETINYLEAALWCAIGLGFLVRAVRLSAKERGKCAMLGIVFIAFAGSDVLEVQTGAWWRPWWLFVWKAGCLAVMVQQLVQYLRRRR